MNRPPWDEYFLKIADLVSTRATCPRLRVGAILVRDRMIISTGYNGSPRKTDQCDEVGCRIVNGHCARVVHAEANTIIQAAYHGISTKGATLYTRYLPCEHCTKILINAGIEKIVYHEVYKNVDQPFAEKLLKQAKVKLIQKPPIFLGFVGPVCAGKGVAIEYLVKKQGFFYSSTSDEIREEISKRGQEITRENLQKTAGEMRQKDGADIWAKRAWEKVVSSGQNRAVVDAIRAVAEVEFLKKQPEFRLVAVLADPKIRFQRIAKRNREGDPKTWEKFLKMETRDKKAEGRNIEACLQMADFEVKNNGTIEELEKQIESVLSLDN